MATKTVKSARSKAFSSALYVTEVANALRKPGLARTSVFRDSASARLVYAYSVSPHDPTQLVRESKDGSKQVGRLVNGKFRAAKAA